ncbi:MAG: DUF6285 domain-containing protein [Gammaproteobacteria bacterium]
MSQDLPTLSDILRTVRDFIDEMKDTVPDKDRYHALCCLHLLGIAEREIADGARLDAAASGDLAAFLGRDLSPREAARVLADGLRNGRFDDRWDAVLPLVLRAVVDKVRVVKPDHLHPMHREEVPCQKNG